jgi:dipeptidyl aminopeptidase/acylaminoacyl peptidase
MFSPANGRNVEYRVYTPPGYNPKLATRYPVVFSLHGENGTPSQRATSAAPASSGSSPPSGTLYPISRFISG